MAQGQIYDPSGGSVFTGGSNYIEISGQVLDPAVSGATPQGTVLEGEAFSGYTGPPSPVVPLVQPSSTTPDQLVLGVQLNTFVQPGAVAQVATKGLVQVLCDATVAFGNALVQSSGTAGCLRAASGTVVVGQRVAVCRQSKTIVTGTPTLVWAYVNVV